MSKASKVQTGHFKNALKGEFKRALNPFNPIKNFKEQQNNPFTSMLPGMFRDEQGHTRFSDPMNFFGGEGQNEVQARNYQMGNVSPFSQNFRGTAAPYQPYGRGAYGSMADNMANNPMFANMPMMRRY